MRQNDRENSKKKLGGGGGGIEVTAPKTDKRHCRPKKNSEMYHKQNIKVKKKFSIKKNL